ncbi:MAG: NAD-glutamate dehydrogenase domain-containing protein, partial [Pseudomonadota bacterium]
LIAAFDHRDIFIDPDPDPEASWTERKRLFDLPRSSWNDYDTALIARGGGVFSRSAKSIPLTDEMKAITGLEAERATPNELISALLKAETDLVWMGGIGTYYKGPEEENWQVGDRANDAIRVDGNECRAKVIGEGANLGLTQKGRIAFARAGGRINTDAIDNAAGVDSSDHEVNIKILLSEAIADGSLDAAARNALLEEMTEDVARHVLRHNYEQTRALSLAEETAHEDTDAYGRFMLALEREGRLDRELEDLPSTDRLAEMKAAGEALTRPEMAVLLAYAKNWLFDALTDSEALDDPHFDGELKVYFPKALHGFEAAMGRHRLRREIIATQLSNEIVNTCGPTFAYRLVESAGASWAEIARAFEIARSVFQLTAFGNAIDNLDNKAPAEALLNLYQEAAGVLRRQVYWLISTGGVDRAGAEGGLRPVIERYRPGVAELKKSIHDVASPLEAAEIAARRGELMELGVPDSVADEAAVLGPMNAALNIVDLALKRGASVPATAQLYFAIGADLGVKSLKRTAASMHLEEHFDRLAVRRIIEDLALHQRDLADAALQLAPPAPEEPDPEWANAAVAEWREAHRSALTRFESVLGGIDLNANLGVGKLSLINRQLRELTSAD